MRYGSDYARAWARRLSFGDVRKKSVLMALANYVDEDGASTVSIPALAEDTDQSEDSVRRRLKDLDRLGVIARFARFIDAAGKINTEGRGRRTYDEIRLRFSADQSAIDAAMQGLGEDETGEAEPTVSPGQQQGPTGELAPASSEGKPEDLALASSKGLTLASGEGHSFCKKEILPPTPLAGGLAPASPDEKDGLGGQGAASAASGDQPDDGWAAFERAFTADGDPITRVSIARQVWTALSPTERKTATVAASGYLAWRKNEKKPATKLGAQTFLRERESWPRFAAMAPPPPPPKAGFVAEDEPLFAALSVCHRIVTGRWLTAEPHIGQAKRGTTTLADRRPDLLALASFAGGDTGGWVELEGGNPRHRQQIAAWRDRVKLWTGLLVDTTKVAKLDAAGRQLTRTVPGLGKSYDMPLWREVLRVPAAWPPRRDGTFGEDATAAALETVDDIL